ncbi:unnamed protein product [Clonostachys chloroleuca]|uniref:Alpha-galactosidase n=1 Tax=Clonostachys chloroleuca TaxID=1926264 RepID=A0AA35Q5F1_9HYPO|nr:unnamed protein product [Clonostachys chloroleuca]
MNLLKKRLAFSWASAVVFFFSTGSAQETKTGIVVDGTSFALNGENSSYRFHVDNTTLDLIADHFGGPTTEDGIFAEISPINGWVNMIGRVRREFPDLGRGDFRTPAVHIRQSAGYTVSEFHYQSHEVLEKKLLLDGLPSTFGDGADVSSLVIHMYDNYSSVAADLTYSIFPKHDAIVRSVKVTNKGNDSIVIEKLASMSIDLPYDDLDLLELRGDWARDGVRVRRPIDYGTQGFGSTLGFSSALHNPFLGVVSSTATESQGDAWGFSLIYTGSFQAEVEKSSQGLTRAAIGFNTHQLSWKLGSGESLTSPECVAVYSNAGIGGMSRKLHRLYRNHLMKSKYATAERPILLNSWEGRGFRVNESSVYQLAKETADLGVSLFVLDDGWFGNEYPRQNDSLGLGDWQPNRQTFPNGLAPLVEDITQLSVANKTDQTLKFGLWFEPEMISPRSTLYNEHPDWALHAGPYPRTQTRNQLVLNLALPEVQDFIIKTVGDILRSAPISYVKWDNNRGIHEAPSPSLDHQYMLGVYRVFEALTSEFPDVLWEGCASGGGRFDPGILHWFPQIWTSDDTDAVERITIQFGTSLAYPPSAMGAHISNVPNGVTKRTTPFLFRAHVAMMGGSFGLELNPEDMDKDELAQLPEILELAERLQPIIIRGDMWRLALPEESQYPAALFISEDGSEAALFAFQTRPSITTKRPIFKLQGLDARSRYTVLGNQTLSGATLMNAGIQLKFENEYDSKVILLQKQ